MYFRNAIIFNDMYGTSRQFLKKCDVKNNMILVRNKKNTRTFL